MLRPIDADTGTTKPFSAYSAGERLSAYVQMEREFLDRTAKKQNIEPRFAYEMMQFAKGTDKEGAVPADVVALAGKYQPKAA